jgi:hypothetical protein
MRKPSAAGVESSGRVIPGLSPVGPTAYSRGG